MASITNDPNGRRRLQFTDANGRRQTVRLGKMPKRTAESVKVYVEHRIPSASCRYTFNKSKKQTNLNPQKLLYQLKAMGGLFISQAPRPKR